MAKYKSGYKRKGNNEKLVTYLLYGFIGLFVIILGGLGIFRLVNPVLGYSNFNDEHLQNFSEVVLQEEEEYFVYFYGVNCGYCTDIKEEVLTFAQENSTGIKVYFIESSDPDDYIQITNPTTGQPQNVAPITDPITGRNMSGTPTFVTVVDGRVVDLTVGPNAITDLLDQVNEGTYTLIN